MADLWEGSLRSISKCRLNNNSSGPTQECICNKIKKCRHPDAGIQIIGSLSGLISIMAGNPMCMIITRTPMTWYPMCSIGAGGNDARGKNCCENQPEQNKFDLFHDSKFSY